MNAKNTDSRSAARKIASKVKHSIKAVFDPVADLRP